MVRSFSQAHFSSSLFGSKTAHSACPQVPDSGSRSMKLRYAMHRMNKLLLFLALPVLGAEPFAWKDLGEGRMELRESGKPALVYNYGVQSREGAPEDRKRCCYIFPVYTPAGVSMLDDFPRDHWHHRGLFWAWP